MEPVEAGTWSKIPGYEDNSDSDDEEELELKARVEERLAEIVAVLGDRWISVPFLKFKPAPAPKDYKDPSKPRGPIPSRAWGPNGPPPCFKLEHTDAAILRETFLSNGFVPAFDKDWVVLWSAPSMREFSYQGLHEYQRVNHFPGSTELTRKDRMWQNLQEKAKVFGRETFDFLPETFVLPDQLEQFLECYEKTDYLWIVKPHASSRGRGIFLLRDVADLPENELSVVSRYVDNPLLIQGLKFDLRVYVLVTGFEPLKAYVYREGLVRFASSPYSTEEEHLQDAYRHLTNYSINKFAENFEENQDIKNDNVGHKWSLSALNKHLQCVGVDVELMWARINDVIMKTLLAVEPIISSKTRDIAMHRTNCFEVYGFDIMVDDNLKAWLLEVNLSPSMQAESPLDWQVKSSLLSDAFNLVGVSNVDRQTISTSRLRTTQMQIRRSLANSRPTSAASSGGGKARQRSSNQAPEFAGAAAEAAELMTKGVVLDSLSEWQLKMLANSLSEVGRRRNFIRLYPTEATLSRYAPLVEPSQSCSLKRSASASWQSLSFGRCVGSRASDSQLLASLLYGPAPTRAPPRRRPSATRRGSTPSKYEGMDAQCVGRSSGSIAKPEGTSSFSSLSTQRLLFMEYLVRVSNACASLTFSDKAKICQSPSSTRLVGFHRQLKRRLQQQEEDVEPERDDGGLIDDLEDLCRSSLETLAKDVWDNEATVDDDPDQLLKAIESSVGSHKLEDLLPKSLTASPNGQKALIRITHLSAAYLERHLSAPSFLPEFRLELALPSSRSNEASGALIVPTFAPMEGSRQPFRRPLSGNGCGGRRSTQEKQRRTPGPLNDLLRASSDPVATSDACNGATVGSGGDSRPSTAQHSSQRRHGHEVIVTAAASLADSTIVGSPPCLGTSNTMSPQRLFPGRQGGFAGQPPIVHGTFEPDEVSPISMVRSSSASRWIGNVRPTSAGRRLRPLEPTPISVEKSNMISRTRSGPSLIDCKLEAFAASRVRPIRSKQTNSIAQLQATRMMSMVEFPEKTQSQVLVPVASFLEDIEL